MLSSSIHISELEDGTGEEEELQDSDCVLASRYAKQTDILLVCCCSVAAARLILKYNDRGGAGGASVLKPYMTH